MDMKWNACFSPPQDFCGDQKESLRGFPGAPSGKERRMTCAVAGMKCVNAPNAILGKLARGVELCLDREPENPYDNNAVVVSYREVRYLPKVRIGYVPRAKNAELAADMDKLVRPKTVVKSVKTNGKTVCVVISVRWTKP